MSDPRPRSLRRRLIGWQMGLLVLLLGVLNAHMYGIIVRSQMDDGVHHLQVQALLAASALVDPLSGYRQEFEGHAEREDHERREGREHGGRERHGEVSSESMSAPPGQGPADLQTWADALGREGRFEVDLFDRSGHPMASARGSGSAGREVDQALEGQEASRRDRDRVWVAAPVKRGGQVMGAVRLSATFEEAWSRARHLALSLLLTSVLVLAAAGAVVAWTSRRLLEPLERLRRGAEEVARGNLGARVEGGSEIEVAAVSEAFNSMVTALRTAAEQQRAFVANASHELRTPLTNIKLRTETLITTAERGTPDLDARRAALTGRYLRDIDRETDRLAILAASLLDLSRLDATPPAPAPPLDPAPIVRAAVDRMQLAAERASKTLECDCPETLPGVAVRSDDLDAMLSNLIDNAIKYTPAGGRIRVEAEAGADVVVRVDDTGPGIPVEDLSQVFDRFYRVDKARSREIGGAGLGLSLVRALAERAGGTATAANREGGGARFSLRFPRAPNAQQRGG